MPITTEAAEKISAVLKETFKKDIPWTKNGTTEGAEKIVTVVDTIDRRQFTALAMLVEDMYEFDFSMKRSGAGISLTFS